MSYVARPIPRGLGFDASTRVSYEQAVELHKAGYRFAIRYVDRVITDPDKDPGGWPINLTTSELADLTRAGLGVGLTQYYATPGSPIYKGRAFGMDHGRQLGEIAAHNAQALGYPVGAMIWMDIEDCAEATPGQVCAEIDGGSGVLAKVGFASGLYGGAGFPLGLTGEMLWARPWITSYWRAASIVPAVPNRGYAMTQGCQVDLELVSGKLRIDADIFALDHRARSSMDRPLIAFAT